MLATFGLERLEAGLTRDAVSPKDVDELLQQATAASVDGVRRRLPEPEPVLSLPTRGYVHHRPNPQFQPTRHVNSV
ncbi:hypothetical protein [Mycobacterium hubeiense]|uniref:hypothetical protein n=1 Tax=Mycobacterium hubeiense TaxID=1867256 RepID=UPI001E328B45|nr:hypothetical protein [Mycobacterium sp. QGD 101]